MRFVLTAIDASLSVDMRRSSLCSGSADVRLVLSAIADVTAPASPHLHATVRVAAAVCRSAHAPTEWLQVRREDVQSVWSGLRPLAVPPGSGNTADAVRDHVVVSEGDGMVTVTGGKWTTYRLMAQDAVDAAVKEGGLRGAGSCVTQALPLIGAAGFSPAAFAHLAQVRSRSLCLREPAVGSKEGGLWAAAGCATQALYMSPRASRRRCLRTWRRCAPGLHRPLF